MLLLKLIILLSAIVNLTGCTSIKSCINETAALLVAKHPRIDSPEAHAAFVIGRKESYKTLRRALKSSVESDYERGVYTYIQFEDQMTVIHSIGNNFSSSYDSINDFNMKTIKNRVFTEEYVDAEEALDIVEWGPLHIDDEGSVRCTLESLTALVQGECNSTAQLISDKQHMRNLVCHPVITDKWAFHARMNFHLSVWKALKYQNIDEVGYRVGTNISLDRVYGSRGHTIYSFEYEVKYYDDGDIVNFFSIAIPLGLQ